MRDLLNSLATWQIVVVVVGGSVVLAVSIAILARKLMPDLAEREFEEMASGLRVVYELMFALILAFAIASVIGKFNDAEATVDREATALSQMFRANRKFPIALQSRLRDGIQTYVFAVTDDEFKSMRVGEQSREAAVALDTLYALYEGYAPAGATVTKYYNQALANLDTVATSRRERLGIANARLPFVLVIMLPVGAILLLLLEYRPRLRPRGQVAFMGTLAIVLSSTYLLTIVLDYPFSGEVSVSSAPLKSGTLAYIADNPPRGLHPGDRLGKLTPGMLNGVFISDAYGTVVLRRDGNKIRGVYRTARGFVRGTVEADGVFRGAWCEGTQRPVKRDAGVLEWRLIETKAGGTLIDGRWQFGYEVRDDGNFVPYAGWDMHPLKNDHAQDLQDRLAVEPESRFCHVR